MSHTRTRITLLTTFVTTITLTLSAGNASAQTSGRSRLLPNPVPSGGGRINVRDPQRGQGEGWFNAPRSNNRSHNGIDLTAPVGTEVQAADGAVVIRSESATVQPNSTPANPPLPGVRTRVDGSANHRNGARNRVMIQHPDGTYSSYFHLRGDNQPGERVVAGQVIGHVGTSGNVPDRADSHLDFEVGDHRGTPVEPRLVGTTTRDRILFGRSSDGPSVFTAGSCAAPADTLTASTYKLPTLF